jgi:hypothetical protein
VTAWHKEARNIWPADPIGWTLLLRVAELACRKMHGAAWQPPLPVSWRGEPPEPDVRPVESIKGPSWPRGETPEFDAVCKIVAEACEDGTLAAAYIAHGGMRPVPQGIWHGHNWLRECFEWGCAFLPGGSSPWIFVRNSDVAPFIAKLPKYQSVQISRPSGKTGPKTKKTEAVAERLRAEINSGKLTLAELAELKEQALANDYGVSRDTARKARNQVLGIQTE